MTTAPAVEVSGKPDPIDCSNYDVDRFMAKVEAARDHWSSYTVPAEWDLTPALIRRPTTHEFQPIADTLAEMREGPERPRDYPARQAFLTFSILHGSFWSADCCRAVAYGTLRVGMVDHHYQPRPGSPEAILVFCEPDLAFGLYGQSLDDLTRLLRAAYVPEGELAGLWPFISPRPA